MDAQQHDDIAVSFAHALAQWAEDTASAMQGVGEALAHVGEIAFQHLSAIVRLPPVQEAIRWERSVEGRAWMMTPERAAHLYALQRTRIRRRQRKGRSS